VCDGVVPIGGVAWQRRNDAVSAVYAVCRLARHYSAVCQRGRDCSRRRRRRRSGGKRKESGFTGADARPFASSHTTALAGANTVANARSGRRRLHLSLKYAAGDSAQDSFVPASISLCADLLPLLPGLALLAI